MTLDDFLRKCRENGAVPLSYRRKTRDVHGNEYTESFESKAYRDMMRIRDMLGIGRVMRRGSRSEGVDDVVSGLYGREVVIRKQDGYYHGILQGYDGKFFYLREYCFSRKPMSIFEYSPVFSLDDNDAVVPAEGVISIAGIPLDVDEAEEVYA
jgi:hypothetical protein